MVGGDPLAGHRVSVKGPAGMRSSVGPRRTPPRNTLTGDLGLGSQNTFSPLPFELVTQPRESPTSHPSPPHKAVNHPEIWHIKRGGQPPSSAAWGWRGPATCVSPAANRGCARGPPGSWSGSGRVPVARERKSRWRSDAPLDCVVGNPHSQKGLLVDMISLFPLIYVGGLMFS